MSQIKGVLDRGDGATPAFRISTEEQKELLRSFQGPGIQEDGRYFSKAACMKWCSDDEVLPVISFLEKELSA